MRQQLRFFIVSRILLVTFASLILVLGDSARAAVTLVEVDPNTISGIEGSANTTVVYAGVTGDVTGGTCGTFTAGTASTCNNCEFVAAGDAGLVPCNKRRVHYEGLLHIRFSSDTADGIPMMVVVNSSTVQDKVPNANTEASVAKGTTADLYVRWKDVCSKFTGGNATCDPTSDEFVISVKVGIDANNDGTFDTGDDSINFTIKVRDGIATTGASSLTGDCSTNPVGICGWSLKSGDQKLTLTNLQAVSGFPLANNITFRYVRVLFAARDATTDPTVGVFSSIHPDSSYADLEIGGTAATGLTLTPARVTGLTNDEVYDVKLAVVDAAGNTGYYTPAAQDFDCEASSINPGNGVLECHVARPSEVVGILSEPVNCFVASAAYGSPMANDVTTFRAFRDRYLAKNALGKSFIRFYYHQGPKLAKFIAGSESRKSIARAALALPLAFSKFALREGGLAAVGLLVLIFGTPVSIALYSWVRRKRGLRA